ncbi:carbon storage regulator [Helicobacter equorum]|uniref:Translational regulator CsrA n=1 Tax=Helicobacter equorum TaxID=361872 RepID=A0A3D8IMS8_9HELI|nr:carbon storage regulator [Helicobacter equorum]MCI7710697.1 carbon storage regulator [Helicobacter sp.]MDD7346031.1 carbon storage regulator [Helicobacter sp.]RDU66587.1 carbon storage regulator [Helicobacter equorum]
MLILSRKQDDGVMIGDDIEIKIISIDKGSVRLGFKAPSNMLILRSELKDAIAMQNQQASIHTSKDLTLPKVGTIKKK